MDVELEAFLADQRPLAEETVLWGDGATRLRITSYLCQQLPPLALITSVRGLVVHGEAVLLVRDQHGYHLLPGGRREGNETLLETLEREVVEETGWTLIDMKLLGFKHFHHLTPRPAEYPYPYPDFLQVVYGAHPQYLRKDRMFDKKTLANEWVLNASFEPISVSRTLTTSKSDLIYLDAALKIL